MDYDKVKKDHNGIIRGQDVWIEKPTQSTRRVYDYYDSSGSLVASYDLNDPEERKLFSQRYVNAK